jgi:hypothetical protein
MAKVMMVITTTGGVDAECSMTCARIAKSYPYVDYYTFKGRPTDYIRNYVVREFLKRDYTHVFMVDSDEAIPIDAVERLLNLNAPLATGCYPAKCDNSIKWALSMRGSDGHYRLLDKLTDSSAPFVVDAGGAGCLLIRRDVFDAIKWPWFRWIENEDGSQMSEDIYFFSKCNEAGLRCIADPQVLVRHYKTMDLLGIMITRENTEEKTE